MYMKMYILTRNIVSKYIKFAFASLLLLFLGPFPKILFYLFVHTRLTPSEPWACDTLGGA